MRKLISLNTEGDKHLERVRAFLEKESPDVICLQEIFEEDIPAITTLPHVVFMPMCLKERVDNTLSPRGIALCSRDVFTPTLHEYYHKPSENLLQEDCNTIETRRASQRGGVLSVTFPDGVHIATTHFTWIADGALPDQYQEADAVLLLAIIEQHEPLLICGDFNMPREQNYLYPVMTTVLIDHVPDHYTSSMHIPLHRVRNDPKRAEHISQFMVDYIFTTPNSFAVENVRMECGMSDHCALVADIEKI